MSAPSRTVLVTGASSGIGEAATLELARRGHHVLAAARRTEALAALADRHAGVTPVPMDVTDPDSVATGLEEVRRRIAPGGVDVLVNNAGFALAGPVETTPGAEVRRQFETNVFGLLDVTRAVLPDMRRRRTGRIVNVSSLLGRTTLPATGVYSASKHAVEALSDALRAELRGFDVDVVVVEPGFVRTELGSHLGPDDGDPSGPYAALLAGSRRYLGRQIAEGADPTRLARLLARVVETRHPRARYVLSASDRLVLGLSAVAPARVMDRAMLRMVTRTT